MIEGLQITNHAADRYVERVKPLLDREGARSEILRLLPTARLIDFPAWIDQSKHQGELAVELTDGIVAVVRDRWMVTICIRGSMKEKTRKSRNKRNSHDRARAQYRKIGNKERRPTPEWNPDE
jgi:hypothetical protein